MFTYEVRFTRLLTEKLDREREGGGRPLSQSLFPRRYHNFWCAVGVASCRACLAFHAPRRAAAAQLCRLVVVSAWLSVEVAYLGSDISVKFHRSLIAARDRLLPPLLRVAIYLIHCLETLNPPPLHAPRWKTDLYNAGHQMLP